MKFASITPLVAIAVIGAAAGYFAYSHYSSRFAAAPTLQPLAPLPLRPAGPAVPAAAEAPARIIPDEVPDVQLADLEGKKHSLREGSGRPHLFNFWATWCVPCRREIPLLNSLQGTFSKDRLQIVGIAVDLAEPVREFLKTTPLNYALLVGEEDGLEAAQQLGMELVLPFSVFADEHDRIVAIKVGELHRDEAEAILASMRALKAGTATLPETRTTISARLKQLAVERAKQAVKS